MKKLILLALLLLTSGVHAQGKKAQDLVAPCNGGDMSACSALGALKYLGLGVKKDVAGAIVLHTKACNGNNAAGCYNLGSLYYYGKDVYQDKEKAKELFKRACNGGNEGGCMMLRRMK